jgi:methyl-accepting chemotaxis protein
MQIVPVSHDLTLISQEVNGILQSIHRQVDKIEDSLTTVRDGAERLREFEENMIQRIEEPLMEMATLLSAVTRGVETFVRLLRR